MNLVLLFSSKRQVGFLFSCHLILLLVNYYNKLTTLFFTGTCMWVVLESSSDGPSTVDQVPHWTRQQILFLQNLHSSWYSVPMKYHWSMSNTLRTVLYNPDCVRYSWKKWYIIGEKSLISMIMESKDVLLNITMLSPKHKWKLYSCPHEVIFTFVLLKDKTIILY